MPQTRKQRREAREAQQRLAQHVLRLKVAQLRRLLSQAQAQPGEVYLECAAELESDERMVDAYRDAARNLRETREMCSRPSLTLDEYIALEGPKWQGVDAVRYVRELRGDSEGEAGEGEAYWKAGFLRGAKFWQGKTNSGTMWQSEQNECWQAANLLWPSVRPESVDDARLIGQANRTHGMALTPAQRSELARSLGIDVDAARRAGVGLGMLAPEAGA